MSNNLSGGALRVTPSNAAAAINTLDQKKSDFGHTHAIGDIVGSDGLFPMLYTVTFATVHNGQSGTYASVIGSKQVNVKPGIYTLFEHPKITASNDTVSGSYNHERTLSINDVVYFKDGYRYGATSDADRFSANLNVPKYLTTTDGVLNISSTARQYSTGGTTTVKLLRIGDIPQNIDL